MGGTVVIVAAKVAIRDSLTIAKPANVWTRAKVQRTVVPGAARSNRTKVMGAATMETTTVAVTGMAVTAVGKAVTNINFLIARNANAKILRKRKRSARRTPGNAPSLHTTGMDVAMTETTTAAAIGTTVTAVGRVTTNTSFRTAPNAIVWIRLTIKMQRNAMDIAELQTTKVMATAMTTTTTAVVNMTVVTVAARKVKNNFSTAKSASAWTQPKNPTRRTKSSTCRGIAKQSLDDVHLKTW